MPRARTAKRKPVIKPGETPTPEQLASGDYERGFITHVETGTVTTAHISASSPVERWKRDGRLSDSQIAAIALCDALWANTGLRQKLTSTYGERLPPGTDNEWIAVREIQARRDLERIEGYVLPWQWEVYENVVRWGEPSGTAGGSLGFNGSKETRAAVLMIVWTVADTIARRERL